MHRIVLPSSSALPFANTAETFRIETPLDDNNVTENDAVQRKRKHCHRTGARIGRKCRLLLLKGNEFARGGLVGERWNPWISLQHRTERRL